ncbi:MAG: hypothetical protein Q4C86_13365 [bacterium]|nr:hypothetical protein [bacterium]
MYIARIPLPPLRPSFTDYGNVPDYYATAPESDGRVCAVCGEDCHCAAKIAALHIYSNTIK